MKKYFFLLATIVSSFSGCRSSILDDPSISIRYDVVQKSHVKLTVENNYNTVVSTLVDTVQSPGIYTATFNAAGLLEGIYYYTLESRGVESSYYSKTTKYLLLIK